MIVNNILKLRQTVNSLLLWQRVVLFFIAISVITIFWYLLLCHPLLKSNLNLSKKILENNNQIVLLSQELEQATVSLKNFINTDSSNEELNLEVMMKNKSKPESKTISTMQISNLFGELLNNGNELTLSHMENLPIKETDLKDSLGRKVYENEIIIKFTGNFFSILGYLQALENLKWQIKWEKLDYHVTNYPNAEVTLRLYILSDENGLMYF